MSPKTRTLTLSMLVRALLVVAVVAIAWTSLLHGPGIVAGVLVGTLLVASFGATVVGIVFGRRAQRTKQVSMSGRR